MSDLLRFTGPTAPGFLVVMAALILLGALVLYVIELRRPPRWNDPASDRWFYSHREGE